MFTVKTDTLVGKTNQNDEAVTEVQKLIVKINNLLQHKDEAEYLVDLMPAEVIKRFGRERVVEAAQIVLKEPVSPELSEKFSKLWQEIGEHYFDHLVASAYEVEVKYVIDDGPLHYNGVVHIPASSEPIIVERMLDEMIPRSTPYSGRDCEECYRTESNRAYIAGAPMSVKPEQRHLSAEQFIAAATREPTLEEKEWLKHQGDFFPRSEE